MDSVLTPTQRPEASNYNIPKDSRLPIHARVDFIFGFLNYFSRICTVRNLRNYANSFQVRIKNDKILIARYCAYLIVDRKQFQRDVNSWISLFPLKQASAKRVASLSTRFEIISRDGRSGRRKRNGEFLSGEAISTVTFISVHLVCPILPRLDATLVSTRLAF